MVNKRIEKHLQRADEAIRLIASLHIESPGWIDADMAWSRLVVVMHGQSTRVKAAVLEYREQRARDSEALKEEERKYAAGLRSDAPGAGDGINDPPWRDYSETTASSRNEPNPGTDHGKP